MPSEENDPIPAIAPGEHEAQRVASNRAWEALMLAKTPEAWSQLLQGNPVPADQLEHGFLTHLKARRAA